MMASTLVKAKQHQSGDSGSTAHMMRHGKLNCVHLHSVLVLCAKLVVLICCWQVSYAAAAAACR